MIPSQLLVVAPPAIKTVANVEAFFRACNEVVIFHPDTPFGDYIHLETRTPTFHRDDCVKLDMLMCQAFDVCEKAGVDIYGIGLDVVKTAPVEINRPCPHCGREEEGKWFAPCPSDDCPSRERSRLIAPVSVWPVHVVDHQIPMPERFILAFGPVAQQLGIDEQVGGDIVIWDQQEHKVVMVVSAEYAQMICLERQSDKACFSALVDWMNKLGNEGLESENIPPSKVATLEQVHAELEKLGVVCSLEHQFIELQVYGDYTACVGQANDTWNGEVCNDIGEVMETEGWYLETKISSNAINAHDVAVEIARAAKELGAKIGEDLKKGEQTV